MKTKRINRFLLVTLLVLTFAMTAALVACGDKKWKVTFNYNYTGAPSAAFAEVEVKDGEKATEPATKPTREGYDFEGWFTDAACAASTAFGFTTTEIKADTTLYAGWKAVEVEPPKPGAANVDIDYASEVTAYDGTWTLTKVYTGGDTKETKDAVAGSITLEIVGEYIFKNVNDAEYIGNYVYNFTSNMTFGIPAINAALGEKSINCYSGKADWSSFTMGVVMAYGADYVQPGPGIMDFSYANKNTTSVNNAMRNNGLFLDQVAGVSADIDTENKELILGMNSDGQLLLGYSDMDLRYPEVTGDWNYCLIFDKAE